MSKNDLYLCTDCTMKIVNDDLSHLDMLEPKESEERFKEVSQAVFDMEFDVALGDDEVDFSPCKCDCCYTYTAGRRNGFNIINKTNEGEV